MEGGAGNKMNDISPALGPDAQMPPSEDGTGIEVESVQTSEDSASRDEEAPVAPALPLPREGVTVVASVALASALPPEGVIVADPAASDWNRLPEDVMGAVWAQLPLVHMARVASVSRAWLSTFAASLASRQLQLKELVPATVTSAVSATLCAWKYTSVADANGVVSKKDWMLDLSSQGNGDPTH